MLFINAIAQRTVFVETEKTTLHTTIYSEEKSETIILLHGGPGVPDDMPEVVQQLKNDYTVITFEQRGVGMSACENCEYRMEDYISDIDAISTYFGLKKIHLFGHSWGGLYAQIYAEARPNKIQSLFLCSPSSGTNKTWKKTEKEVLKFARNTTTTKEWSAMGWNSLLGMFGYDKAYQKLFKQVIRNYHKGYCDVEIKNQLLERIHTKPVNKTRKEIVRYKALTTFNKPKYPIIITYGENDIYGESKKELLNRFPTAQVETIKNCGHIAWKHNPNAFYKVIAKFYSKTKPHKTKKVLVRN